MDTKTTWATIKERATRRLAVSHIAGPSLEEAIQVCMQAAEHGWTSTLCPWSNALNDHESMFLRYYQSVRSIALHSLDSQISVKFSDLAHNLELVRRLAEFAAENRLWIMADALDVVSAGRTLDLVEKISQCYRNIGMTLPARWQRSFSDVERCIELGIPVRIVKGQWPDAVKHRQDLRSLFLELTGKAAGRVPKVAVATHNRSLATEALGILRAAETSCELEQMIGLPLLRESVAQPMGVPTRLYVPYGYPYLPYNVSDIWSHPVIVGWLVRDLLVKRESKLAHIN